VHAGQRSRRGWRARRRRCRGGWRRCRASGTRSTTRARATRPGGRSARSGSRPRGSGTRGRRTTGRADVRAVVRSGDDRRRARSCRRRAGRLARVAVRGWSRCVAARLAAGTCRCGVLDARPNASMARRGKGHVDVGESAAQRQAHEEARAPAADDHAAGEPRAHASQIGGVVRFVHWIHPRAKVHSEECHAPPPLAGARPSAGGITPSGGARVLFLTPFSRAERALVRSVSTVSDLQRVCLIRRPTRPLAPPGRVH